MVATGLHAKLSANVISIMLGRGSAPPQIPPLSVNAFCIVTNSAHETPVYPIFLIALLLYSFADVYLYFSEFVHM